MDQIVVQRTFQVTRPNGVQHELTLRIGVPRNTGEDWEWYTDVELWLDSELLESMEIFGPADSLSSLTQALWIGGIRVRVHQQRYKEKGWRLTWLGTDDVDIPTPPSST